MGLSWATRSPSKNGQTLLCRAAAIALLFLLPAFAPAVATAAGRPGQFDYFLMSLTWAPQFCAEHPGTAGGECQPGNGQGFLLHGLWPQDDDGSWPASCRHTGPVPRGLVDQVLPFMPGTSLVQHEWAKHGTCSGLSMEEYFDDLARAFRKVQIPPELQQPRIRLSLGVTRFKQMFAEANPGLTAAMMTVSCGRDNEISEARFCLDKSLAFRRCGADQSDDCRGDKIRVPPVQ